MSPVPPEPKPFPRSSPEERYAGAFRTIERATIVKVDFARWLPAIAKDSYRKTAMSVAGVAALGGLALAPTAADAPVTSGPHQGPSPPSTSPPARPPPPRTRMSGPSVGLTTGSATGKPPAGSRPHPADPARHGGAQSRVPLDDAQLANARAIVDAAKKTGVGDRGAVIGVATSLQESKLYNLGHLGAYNDHDSQGLFQQRPSSGWGTPDQITDPEYAATAFFTALKNVGGWQDLPLTGAARPCRSPPSLRVRAVGGAGGGHRPADLVTPAHEAGRLPSTGAGRWCTRISAGRVEAAGADPAGTRPVAEPAAVVGSGHHRRVGDGVAGQTLAGAYPGHQVVPGGAGLRRGELAVLRGPDRPLNHQRRDCRTTSVGVRLLQAERYEQVARPCRLSTGAVGRRRLRHLGQRRQEPLPHVLRGPAALSR